LIVPHIIKTLYQKSSDQLIFPTFFYGGVFLVLCDLIARNLGASSDIPIGVITSLLGGPFFIYLILHRNRGR
jgi:iron complex transport system permease protein